MSTFAVSTSDNYDEVIGAVNYALSNLGTGGVLTSANGNVLIANTVTGVISSINNSGATQVPVINYLYGYVNVKYANSASGASGFSSNSAYANYYGVRNTTDGVISTNPTDYTWNQVAGGFGATKFLYYTTGGGNTINFAVGTAAPAPTYQVMPDNTAVLLQQITSNAVVTSSIQNAAITNVQIASNTVTGNNIKQATITGNLIAANTITGNLIQANTITGNLIQANTITGNSIVANSITGNQIQAQTITGNNIAGNTITGNLIQAQTITGNNIAGNTITGNLIQAQTITGNNIAGSTITGNNIAGNTITGNLIAALTITGNNIAGNTITADKLQVNTIVATNSIQSNNAIFGNYQSPGYWLDSFSGNVRMAGNVSVGSNLYVDGLIVQNVLSNNTVATQNIQPLATFNISFAQTPTAAPTLVNYINGTGYWPDNTRGLPISGGVSIIPTTNGAVSGSRIVVNYNSYISTTGDPSFLLVELWKQSQTPYYLKNWRSVSFAQPTARALANIASPYYFNGSNWFYFAGDNGYIGWSYTGGNTITTQAPTGVTSSTTSINSVAAQVNWNDFTSMIGGTPYHYQGVEWIYSQWWNPGWFQTTTTIPPRNSPPPADTAPNNPSFYGTIISNTAPGSPSGITFTPYDSIFPTAFGYGGQNVLTVGSGGSIVWYANPFSGPIPPSGVGAFPESTSILADLYSVCQDRNPLNSNAALVRTVAVGSVGTVLNCVRTYETASGGLNLQGNLLSRTSWLQYNSHSPYNLNAVAANWSDSVNMANLYVAVGEFGTVTTSPDGQNWTLGSTGFSGTLNGLAYGNGQWVAVGVGGVILTSNNAVNWTQVSSPASNVAVVGSTARSLNDVAYNPYSNTFVAVGEEIVLTATGSNVAAWSTSYLGTATFSSNISRVQYYGSYPDVNQTGQPPSNQRLANNQVFNGTYVDADYIKDIPVTYYMVAGSLYGIANDTYAGQGSMTVTEYKR